MLRLVAAAFIASLLLGSCGCFMPLGVAYPTVSYTPKVPIREQSASEVRAFRVDFIEYQHASKSADRLKCEFSGIEVDSNHEVPRQIATGIRYYWALFFVPGGADPMLGSVRCRDKWVRVRLYRPGFKTVEVGPDSTSDESPEWEPVDTLKGREEAIDTLVGIKKDATNHLTAGHASKKHKEFLQFAATEYLQLAQRLDENDAEHRRARTRVLKKYNRLRELEAE